MQDTTLIYLRKPETNEILLAMKKRRFGAGKLNGVGGKLEGSESVFENAEREVNEEIMVSIDSQDLHKVADITFIFDGKPEWNQHTHAFFIDKWIGEPQETEELLPEWFKIESLPYEKMWIDDPLWLPQALEGKKLSATFTFNEDGSKVLKSEVIEIKEF